MRPNSLEAKLRAGQRVVGALITINAGGYQALLVVTGPLIVNAARSFLQVLRS